MMTIMIMMIMTKTTTTTTILITTIMTEVMMVAPWLRSLAYHEIIEAILIQWVGS